MLSDLPSGPIKRPFIKSGRIKTESSSKTRALSISGLSDPFRICEGSGPNLVMTKLRSAF